MLLVCGSIICSHCSEEGVLYCVCEWCYSSCLFIRGGCLLMYLVSGVIAYDYGVEEGVFYWF